jgi:hypothetical protein
MKSLGHGRQSAKVESDLPQQTAKATSPAVTTPVPKNLAKQNKSKVDIAGTDTTPSDTAEDQSATLTPTQMSEAKGKKTPIQSESSRPHSGLSEDKCAADDTPGAPTTTPAVLAPVIVPQIATTTAESAAPQTSDASDSLGGSTEATDVGSENALTASANAFGHQRTAALALQNEDIGKVAPAGAPATSAQVSRPADESQTGKAQSAIGKNTNSVPQPLAAPAAVTPSVTAPQSSVISVNSAKEPGSDAKSATQPTAQTPFGDQPESDFRATTGAPASLAPEGIDVATALTADANTVVTVSGGSPNEKPMTPAQPDAVASSPTEVLQSATKAVVDIPTKSSTDVTLSGTAQHTVADIADTTRTRDVEPRTPLATGEKESRRKDELPTPSGPVDYAANMASSASTGAPQQQPAANAAINDAPASITQQADSVGVAEVVRRNTQSQRAEVEQPTSGMKSDKAGQRRPEAGTQHSSESSLSTQANGQTIQGGGEALNPPTAASNVPSHDIAVAQNSHAAPALQSADTPASTPSAATPKTPIEHAPQEPRAYTLVETARLVERAASAEMKVGVQTPELGKVEVRATLRDNAVGATLSVERPEVQRMIAAELPALHRSLDRQQVELQSVSLMNAGAGDSGPHGREQESPQRQAWPRSAESHSRPMESSRVHPAIAHEVSSSPWVGSGLDLLA